MTELQIYFAVIVGTLIFFIILYNVIKSATYSAIKKASQERLNENEV